MSGEHSILSPSKGAMILRCAAALAAGKGVKDTPSQYAAEGTAYHQLSAAALEHGVPCADAIGTFIEADGFKFLIDEENAAYAQTYVDRILELPGSRFVEVRLDTSEVVGVPGQSGTGDAVTLDFEHDTIHVDDLKFGRGEVVFAEKNEQLLQYGAAALVRFALVHDWKFVKLGIHQPRLHHYSEHTYTVEEVRAWVKENQPKFQRAYALYQNQATVTAADYVPGDKQCRWCPIRGFCKARTDQFLHQFPIEEPSILIPRSAEAPVLTDEALAAARGRVDAIEQWCSDIKAEAHNRAVLMGKHLPGWKVVNGRAGNRKWVDEASVETRLVSELEDAAFKPRALISPAEAEKAFKKAKRDFALVAPFIVQAEGAKSLVRDDSPKQAVAVQQIEFPVQAPA